MALKGNHQQGSYGMVREAFYSIACKSPKLKKVFQSAGTNWPTSQTRGIDPADFSDLSQ